MAERTDLSPPMIPALLPLPSLVPLQRLDPAHRYNKPLLAPRTLLALSLTMRMLTTLSFRDLAHVPPGLEVFDRQQERRERRGSETRGGSEGDSFEGFGVRGLDAY